VVSAVFPSAALSNFSSWYGVLVTERREAYLLEAHISSHKLK
jgi:hypothetical protein